MTGLGRDDPTIGTTGMALLPAENPTPEMRTGRRGSVLSAPEMLQEAPAYGQTWV